MKKLIMSLLIFSLMISSTLALTCEKGVEITKNGRPYITTVVYNCENIIELPKVEKQITNVVGVVQSGVHTTRQSGPIWCTKGAEITKNGRPYITTISYNC